MLKKLIPSLAQLQEEHRELIEVENVAFFRIQIQLINLTKDVVTSLNEHSLFSISKHWAKCFKRNPASNKAFHPFFLRSNINRKNSSFD